MKSPTHTEIIGGTPVLALLVEDEALDVVVVGCKVVGATVAVLLVVIMLSGHGFRAQSISYCAVKQLSAFHSPLHKHC